MKFRISLALMVVSIGALAQEPVAKIRIQPDRQDHRYEEGETVTFTISPMRGRDLLDFGSVEYSVKDGLKIIEADTVGVTGEPIEIKAEATRPGFIWCHATFIGPAKKSQPAKAAVAISPEKISASRSVPVDFVAFWDEQKARLAEVNPEGNATMQPVGSKNFQNETFDIKVDCGEEIRPVSGYYSRPKNAQAKSHPAILWVHGAGVRSAIKSNAEQGANDGFISLDINAHGIRNGVEEGFYKSLSTDGFLKQYPTQGRENRDGSYFKGMFLRLVRAIDFLTAQPEWDGKTVAVIGHSQGGAQAIAAGGLDDRVTFIGAGVPAMCDHTGMLRKRNSGWPRIVPVDSETGKPDPQIAEVSRYFDCMNFATRFHGEAIFSVGFVDHVCPPAGVYATFNQIPGEKRMINEPTMSHNAPAEIKEQFRAALKAHAGR